MERRRKRLFNSYFKKNENKHILVYDYDDKFYLVSNGISLLKVEKTDDLVVNTNKKDMERLMNYLKSFETDYIDYGKRIKGDLKENDIIARYRDNKEYSIDKDLLDNISNIILPTSDIKVLENTINYIQCVVYMENKNTREKAYILPIRVF